MPAFKYALGCIKDSEDPRDRKLARLPPSLRVALPSKLDYSKKMSPVSDQGQEGTCVGFASVDGMKEYQEKTEWKKLIQLSVRYLYVEARKLDTWSSDEGTTIRSAMKALNKKGVPPEDCWKYAVHQTDKPCPNADELAKPYQTVIAIDRQALPTPAEVDGWSAEEYVGTLQHDQACPRFSVNFRQMVHISFRLAAEQRPQYLSLLEVNRATIEAHVSGNLWRRHMEPLFLGTTA